jgi:hypothetical protein
MMSDAEQALAALARDLIEEISAGKALELAAGQGQDHPPRPLVFGLTPAQLALAANRDMITPVIKGSGKWCGYCGNVNASQLEPGADQQKFGTPDDWMCKDEHMRACLARHDRRFPPDPSRPPAELMRWAREADEAKVREIFARIEAAGNQTASGRRSGREVTEAGEEEAAQPAQQAGPPVPQAVPVPGGAWSHTLQAAHNRTHLLGHQAAQLYGHSQAGVPVQQASVPPQRADTSRRRRRRA